MTSIHVKILKYKLTLKHRLTIPILVKILKDKLISSALPCDTDPCQNRGWCKNKKNIDDGGYSFDCVCQPGFQGQTCEVKVANSDSLGKQPRHRYSLI